MDNHKRIEELIKNKIYLLEKGNDNNKEKELEKFKALFRLINNQYESFFEKIHIDVAIAILKDIGIPENNLLSMYNELLKEEMSRKYTLLDIDLEDDEQR